MVLTQEFINKYKDKNPHWGFNGLGYITYKRTYARKKSDGSTEEWWETVQRCVEWLHDSHVKMGIEMSHTYYEELYDVVFNLKANFSGRMLWQAGTETVDRLGGASLNNCWGLVVDDKKTFLHALDYLMLGGGVGYNIQERYVNKLPKIKENVTITRQDNKSADFIIPDTREGWVAMLNKLLTAFFETGESFTYSAHLVRPYGEPIKGFGGTASGPEPLVKGVDKIATVMQARAGKKLRAIDVLDIMNILGELVVAGNVRRSAQIALGDSNDMDFLAAKDWSNGNIPSHRAMSNNTVVCNDIHSLPEHFWDGYLGNGEPYGLFNIGLARKKGRVADDHRTDPDVISTNPCAEISLSPSEGDGGAESCNLCEIYLNNLESPAEFERVATLMYPVVKTIALMKYHHKETHAIVSKNLRLGIGLTGIVQRPDLVEPQVLTNVYRKLEETDRNFAQRNNVAESIKLTCVKPSGCSVKETMLITGEGLLTLEEMGDINGEEWQEHNITVSQENSIEKSDKFYVNGKVQTKKILTSGGIELESSLTHQYRVLRDGNYVWVKTPDLKIGDILPFKVGGYEGGKIQQLDSFEQKKITNNVLIKQPDVLNADLAWFLGLYLADGSTHKKGIRIAGDVNKLQILEKAKQIAFDQFGLEGIIYERAKGNNADLYLNSSNLLKWLGLNNMIKPKTLDIEIPLIIRKSPKDIISAYIDGYADGDGSVKTNGRSFCTTSKTMARQLVVVLRAIGIDAKCRMMPPTESSFGNNMRYWISERKGRKAETRYISNDIVSVWNQLDKLGMNDFSFDRIVDITDSENHTYDISVPKNHTYIAESYVNHNTLSLLGGATPGVHPAYAKTYIRRIRMSVDDSLVQLCRDAGYKIEHVRRFDGTEDDKTVVVEFPVQLEDGVIIAAEMTAVKQLELHKHMQTYWADNQVSVTVYYRKEELPEIRAWLAENYNENVKSVSFLLHSDHGFDQAPYEEISDETYQHLVSKLKPMDFNTKIEERGMLEMEECDKGSCPIR